MAIAFAALAAAVVPGASSLAAASQSCSQTITPPAISPSGEWVSYGVEPQCRAFYVVRLSRPAQRIRVPGVGTWAPKSDMLAFTKPTGSGSEALYIMRPRGRPRQLAVVKSSNFEWSPTGGALAVTIPGSRVSEPDLSVVGLDGSTAQIGPGDDPVWSPDGRWLAYEAMPPYTIGVARADGTQTRTLTPGVDQAWCAQGSLISFVSEPGLYGGPYVIRPDGSGKRVLGPESTFPSCSPDGRHVAVTTVSFRLGKGPQPDPSTELVDLATSARYGPFHGSPSWSPTGRELALFGHALYRGLVLRRADGSYRRVVTRRRLWGAEWSPSGRRILLEGGDRAGTLLAVGSSGRHLRSLGHGIYPQWLPAGNRIVYLSPGQCNLWIQDVRTGERSLLARCRR